MKRLIATALLIALGGCETTNEWTNKIEEYIPGVGERCERFQCVGGGNEGGDNYIPESYVDQSAKATDDNQPPEPQRKKFPSAHH